MMSVLVNGQIINMGGDNIIRSNRAGIIDLSKRYDSYNQQARNLFARMDIQPDALLKSIINDSIAVLIDEEIWDSLDGLYITGLHTEQASQLNWIGDTFNLVPINSPIWYHFYGYTGTGSSFLNTNFISGVGTNLSQFSVLYGFAIDSMCGSINKRWGNLWTSSAPYRYLFIFPVNTSNNTDSRGNADISLTYANTSINRSFIANRVGTTHQLYVDNNKVSATHGATQPPLDELFFLGSQINGGYTVGSCNNMKWGVIGGGLSEEKILKLKQILDGIVTTIRSESVSISPENSATVNSILLQAMLDGGNKTINITEAGTYSFNSSHFIESNTTINFSDGVYVETGACNTFINKGSLTRTYDSNIVINGLKLITNEDQYAPENVWGLRGHIAFYYCKDLTITNFECLDGGTYNFMFHFAKVEDVNLTNINIESQKDGIKIHDSHDMVIDNYRGKTKDDYLSLMCSDYSYIQPPCIGDIYNIELKNSNYPDSAKEYGARGFMNYLATWDDWTNGYTYNTGNYCLNDGKVYMCSNGSGFSGVGSVAPTHTSDTLTGADGICWNYMDTSSVYHADIYNITIDSTNFYDPSTLWYSQKIYGGGYAGNIYPGTDSLASMRDITFSNCSISNTKVVNQIGLEDITFDNCVIDSTNFMQIYDSVNLADTLHITCTNNEFNNIDPSKAFIAATLKTIFYQGSDNSYNNSVFINSIAVSADLRAINYNLPFSVLTNISPQTGDTCRSVAGLFYWDGNSWESAE